MKKEKQFSDCELYLNSVIENTLIVNPKLGEVLNKWRFLILKTAKRVAFFKEESCEDALGDLLIPLVQLNETYEDTHYRYKRKIYEVEYEDSSCMLLTTPQYSKLKKDRFVTMRDKVEKVNKASLSSLAYHKIQQTGSRLLRDYFTQKNGYTVVDSTPEVVKVRKNEYKKTYKVTNKKTVTKPVELRLDQSIDDEGQHSFYDVIASSYDQESVVDFNIILSNVYEICSINFRESLNHVVLDPCLVLLEVYELCSSVARKLLKALVKDSKASERSISNRVKMSDIQFTYAKREIKLLVDKVLDRGYKPVYSPYIVYEGNYFFKGDETDYRVGLKDVENNMVFVDKRYVEYDQETPYRTPVHLTADML